MLVIQQKNLFLSKYTNIYLRYQISVLRSNTMKIGLVQNNNKLLPPQEDLFNSTHLFLCIGRALGFIPITGLFQKDLNRVQVA